MKSLETEKVSFDGLVTVTLAASWLVCRLLARRML